jgi:arylformamidase
VSRLIDISPPIAEGIGVWPGDVPYGRSVNLSIAEGANIDLSSITTTVHLGAHADAPNHYVADGQDIAARDLSYYYGPCQVVRVDVARGSRILPSHLPGPVTAPRVLFRTGTFPDPNAFNEDFASLSAGLVEHLHEQGVRLVGLDTPSVDLFADKVLESHQALARHDMANLEGLILDHVEPGTYTLIALPLRLVGADASPVRAALVDLHPTGL